MVAYPGDEPDGGRRLAQIHWEGDSIEVIRGFPSDARQNLGSDLRRLQQGLMPMHFRPLQSIGRGVFELKDSDEHTWYRVVYLSRINDVIYVLHCFEKQGRKMPKRDAETARQRLKSVRQRLRMEKEHGKQP